MIRLFRSSRLCGHGRAYLLTVSPHHALDFLPTRRRNNFSTCRLSPGRLMLDALGHVPMNGLPADLRIGRWVDLVSWSEYLLRLSLNWRKAAWSLASQRGVRPFGIVLVEVDRFMRLPCACNSFKVISILACVLDLWRLIYSSCSVIDDRVPGRATLIRAFFVCGARDGRCSGGVVMRPIHHTVLVLIEFFKSSWKNTPSWLVGLNYLAIG